MKKIPNIRNFVINGAWSPEILTPSWINKYLLDIEDENIKVKHNVTNDRIVLKILETINFDLVIESNSLFFLMKKYSDDVYSQIIDCISNLFKALPHTPIYGCGINFRYLDEDTIPFELVKQSGLDFVKTQEQFTYDYDDFLVNTSIVKDVNSTIFDFNFSFKIVKVIKIQEILDYSLISKLETKAEQIINELKEVFYVKK